MSVASPRPTSTESAPSDGRGSHGGDAGLPASDAASTEAPDAGLGAADAASTDGAVPGDGGEAGVSPECPAEGMARIGKFCIDRYEAHLVTRTASGELTPWPHYRRPEAGVTYEARSAAGVFPQAYISRVEAKAACTAAGKRLCTMTEWRRACRGSRGLRYPYGGRYVAGRCNSGKPHLLFLRHGNDPRLWKYEEHFNDPTLDQEPGFLARSGEHPECTSDAQVFDLVGNLHEWVSDSVTESFMQRLEADGEERRAQPWRRGNGAFLGGFFSTLRELGTGCSFATVAHEPAYHDYSTGFRCCAASLVVDPPSSLAPPRRPR